MNKYEIVKNLGQGGYGTANLVRRKSDKKLFVEKEVRLTSLNQKDRDNAIQEAKLLASLRHPYIVEYEESFQEKGNLYIVMRYADGGDLAKKIENRGTKLFTEEEILHDFIEIALAIKYLHDRKICHRDLKGQNIFLTKDGTIKLGDFGISKILENSFQACKTQIGTPFYLSPEICNGLEYDTKTDIWSLGCILYELCTLKHAFSAPSLQMLMVNIIQARYSSIPSHYSQDLRGLVDKMLTKEPERRPTINQIINTPFIKRRLGSFLDKNLLEYELGHTGLHDRKPFAPPTVIIGKEQPPQPSNNNDKDDIDNDSSYDEYMEQQMKEQQKQIQMKEAELKRKEAELAARERALQSNKNNNNRYVNHSNDNDGNVRAKQYYEQKRAMLDNKARMQQEMSGNNMKQALQNQFPKDQEDDIYNNNRKQNKNSYQQQARDNYVEQMRLARANRERMKLEELQGSQMKQALMYAQTDDDIYEGNRQNNRKGNNKNRAESEDYEDLNAYMRLQRQEAAANKRRLEEAMRGSAAKAAIAQSDQVERTKHQTMKRKNFNEKTNKYEYDYDYYSDYYSDYSENQRTQQQKQQQHFKQKQKEKEDFEARNEYMRQLRHEREANRLRAMEYENVAREEENRKKQGVDAPMPSFSLGTRKKKQQVENESTDSYYVPQTKKKVEISIEERNNFMREERRKRRENKALIEAMWQIDMDQIIAEAEAEQRANNNDNDYNNNQHDKSKKKRTKQNKQQENNSKIEKVDEDEKENKGNVENKKDKHAKCCLLI